MHEQHPFTVEKPWGNFRQFTKDETTTVKLIAVKKGNALSLQSHQHRSEFWHVISGNPTITINETRLNARPKDEFFIPQQSKHRVEAPDNDVLFLEISYGKFDENDITRYEDNYGRI